LQLAVHIVHLGFEAAAQSVTWHIMQSGHAFNVAWSKGWVMEPYGSMHVQRHLDTPPCVRLFEADT
jgi:hypothetical protein